MSLFLPNAAMVVVCCGRLVPNYSLLATPVFPIQFHRRWSLRCYADNDVGHSAELGYAFPGHLPTTQYRFFDARLVDVLSLDDHVSTDFMTFLSMLLHLIMNLRVGPFFE